MAKTKMGVDLDLNQNELQNGVLQNLASAPATPKAGQLYFNTADHKVYVYNGTQWVDGTSPGTTYIFSTGLTESSGTVTLNQATTSGLGGVIVGSNISVSSGTISVADASESTKGVIEIATDAEASTGTDTVRAINAKQLATKVTANAAITAGAYTKVTVDTKGLVTSGGSLVASDIPDISATYVPQTSVGQANGVASLGADGKVPSAQLPSFVDDVVDAYIVSGATPLTSGWLSLTSGGSALTPETDKIYVIVEAGAYQNKTYRWSGSTYVEIGAAPGQATESTAGIAEIATAAEVAAGTDDTTIVTPLKLAGAMSGSAFKETATNPALTQLGGVCTWTLTTSKAPGCVVAVYETSGGAEVLCDVTHGSGSLTIKINSASNISAGFYTAVVVG